MDYDSSYLEQRQKNIRKSVALEHSVYFCCEMFKAGKLKGEERKDILVTVLKVAEEFEKWLK